MARHDALIQQCVERNGGNLVRPRGEGDSRFAVFARARDAVAATGDIQQALAVEPWPTPTPLRVRIALHTGEADLRAGDYYGSVVNRCARLRAIGYGGQTLLSQSTFGLVRDSLPENVSLRDLGEHRLKDLQRPEHVYQLCVAGLPADFPPLLSVDAFRNNLPAQLTSFVGRDRELSEIKTLLTPARLLTVTGPGGTGKTRLSLQLAAEVLHEFADGVWLVELAPLADPTLVTQTVAGTLGVREEPGRTILDLLLDYLRAKHLLLILDNCEHLVEAAAQLTHTLLSACPHLKILASSREALGVPGETAYRLPSLSLPDAQAASLDSLLQNDCVRLFVERAMAAYPPFRLQEKNAFAIADICTRLDGIPLAIELAAARTKVFSPEQIDARLDDRFRLLTGGSRTALPRQQTLRALIDWSYDLLSEAESVLLRRLSVFAGGWSFEAAQTVCGDGSETGVLDVLTHLIDKSLVAVDDQAEAEQGRYRLLETIRQYARDKLFESGESASVRDRHLGYFVRFAEEAEPNLRGPDQPVWLHRVATEHDNLRTALAWSLEVSKSESALRLAGAAVWFWWIHGDWSEGQKWLDDALTLGEREQSRRAEAAGAGYVPSRAQLAQRAKVLYGAGLTHFLSGIGQLDAARTEIEESLRLWRSLEDNWWIAVVLKDAGQLHMMKGEVQEARARLEEGVALARGVEDKWALAVCLAKLGLVLGQVDPSAARQNLEEAVFVSRAVGDKSILIYALVNLAAIYFFQGDYHPAEPLAEEALAAARALGSKLDMFFGLFAMGLLNVVQGHQAEAKPYLLELLALTRETGSVVPVIYTLVGFGARAVVSGQPKQAAQLFGALESLLSAVGLNITVDSGPTSAVYKTFLQSARAQLDEATFDAAFAEGRALTLEQALALATEDDGNGSQLPPVGPRPGYL